MTELFEINVKLSGNQKKNLSNAYHKRETIVLRLTSDSLHGNDTLYVPAMIKKRLEKGSKTNIRKQVGGSLLSTVLTLGRSFAPTIAKTLGLSSFGGLASEGASQLVKAISGKGVQTGGLIIPHNKINELMPYTNMFTTKQQRDILNALQSGSGVRIKPTKTQSGGFLGTPLASIGIPMAVDLVKNLISGKGAPRIGSKRTNGKGAPRIGLPKIPPPLYSYPPYVTGNGKKKKRTSTKKGTGLLLGKNSPFNNIPILGALL